MVGRELADIYPPKAGAVERGRPVLEVEGLTVGDRVRGRQLPALPRRGARHRRAGRRRPDDPGARPVRQPALDLGRGPARRCALPAGGAGRCDRARGCLPDRGSPGRRPAPEPPGGAQHHAACARRGDQWPPARRPRRAADRRAGDHEIRDRRPARLGPRWSRCPAAISRKSCSAAGRAPATKC